MSKNQLYNIENLQVAEGIIAATLMLNAEHAIFEGHFPGQPVLPGACMLDMVKDVASVAFEKNLRLVIANNLKFIAPVDPSKSSRLQISINHQSTNDGIKIKAVVTAESPCMKMEGVIALG